MNKPYVGEIVHYQHGTEPQDIRPAIVLQVLDNIEHRCALQLLGSRYVEYVDSRYCEMPKQGTWHYIPRD